MQTLSHLEAARARVLYCILILGRANIWNLFGMLRSRASSRRPCAPCRSKWRRCSSACDTNVERSASRSALSSRDASNDDADDRLDERDAELLLLLLFARRSVSDVTNRETGSASTLSAPTTTSSASSCKSSSYDV